jgi:Domain of unknown function (DUF4276)
VARSKTEPGRPTRVFGVLAEDGTDCDTVRVLIRRSTGDPGAVVKSRYGHGCGELRKRASAWMHALVEAGCTHLVLVHDLDRGRSSLPEPLLRAMLEAKAYPARVPRLICIPIEEIEAWFLSDPALIKKKGARGSKGRTDYPKPHREPDPKQLLGQLLRDERGRYRYDTNWNPELAELLDLDVCAKRCPAFAELRAFVART